MPAATPSSVVAEVVALPSARIDSLARRQSRLAEAWQAAPIPADVEERRLQRRARRQALALMIGSSVLSILVIYTAWTLLRGLI